MPRSGPRKLYRYSDEFKLTAVRLSQQPGIQVQTVAAALEIHPFMLSKWRKEAKDGRLRGRSPKAPPPGPVREIAHLQQLERKYALIAITRDSSRSNLRLLCLRASGLSRDFGGFRRPGDSQSFGLSNER